MTFQLSSLKHAFRKQWVRYLLLGLSLCILLFLGALQTVWGSKNPFWVGLAGLVSLGAILALAIKIKDLSQRQHDLEQSLRLGNEQVAQAYRRLEAFSQIIQLFLDASDENQVIQPVLAYLVDLSQADGASFVPLDEHGQPQTAMSHGRLPFPLINNWVEYLASPQVRESCQLCEQKQQNRMADTESCPLMQGPFSNPLGMACFPVRRGEREFGVVNLFTSKSGGFDAQTLSFLRTVIEEMALGLDSVRLRRREFASLRQMQILRQQVDLQALLQNMLENAFQTLEAGSAMMIIPRAGNNQSTIQLVHGDFSSQAQAFAQGILQSVISSGEPLVLGSTGEIASSEMVAASSLRSVIAAPLRLPEQAVLGAILMGDQHARHFHQRQLVLLQTIAGQMALVVQNSNLMSELSYKTMIQERRRLAREIHDGLAQTLGFLKLQAAQLRSQFQRDEMERAGKNIELIYATVSEAYQDARQAIDGLRISPSECGLVGWIEQTAQEFQELSSIQVRFDEISVQMDISSEIQAQLIRIVQEALSNVRKHSGADSVSILCRQLDGDLVLEVHDNGCGFAPEDEPAASQHGLRGMRERADLIGADFQVISQPLQGTTVRILAPLNDLREMML